MIIENKNNYSGFTIIELLVVIVVIGILATITMVSFTGLSQKAVAASLKSDLANAARKLKMYQVEHNVFPASINSDYCPIEPIIDNKYCLEPSSGNVFNHLTYMADNDASPQTFLLSAKSGSISYDITHDSVPFITPVAPPVSASGGNSVNDVSGNRVHTFTSGGTFTVESGGIISVLIKGGGGGGGACYSYAGGSGGLSSIKIGSDSPYVANGGGGGGDGYGDVYSNNSPGSTIPKEITGITGGASNGGAGATGCGDGNGDNGGPGGSVNGAINIASGKVVAVVVGLGGGGGDYYGYPSGQAGGPGSVSFTYAL